MLNIIKTPSQSNRSEIDGCRAWFTLACIFVINASTLGSLKIYGLIFEEIVSQGYYNREQASWPIATATTIQNLAGVLTPLLALVMSWRSIELVQTGLFVIANVGAYLSQGLVTDILCLGVIQGVALSLRYNMNVVINNEYFVKYRTTAMGISLAGSTCGVFALKPWITYVLDTKEPQFRYAYLALGLVMSFNIILNLFIRRPLEPARPGSPDSQGTQESFNLESNQESLSEMLLPLMKTSSIHCIWMMQTLYFYISRTYTIFIVDYGVDQGLTRESSRNLLEYWVYGEFIGRILLGPLIDIRLLSLKWNIVLVNLLLSLSGFALLYRPSIGNDNQDNYQLYLGISVALVAALSSLINMLIVPFGQEYLGKRNVPWAFAIGSIVTSIFLLFRPSLIGYSRDTLKSYNLLIIVMSSGPFLYAISFSILEPLLSKYKPGIGLRPESPQINA